MKSDMCGSLIITVLQTEIPNELSFSDLECLDVISILKVFERDLIAREKLFWSERNTDLFRASSLLAGTEKSEKKADVLCLFYNKNHKSQSCKIVTYMETRRNVRKDKKCCLILLFNGGTYFKGLFE